MNDGHRLSIPALAEWLDQTDTINHFRLTRQHIDLGIIACTDTPSVALLQKACDCIRSSTRRIPLNPDEKMHSQERLQALHKAAKTKDADAYSRNLAAAILYLTLPQTIHPDPSLCQPWLAQIISSAVTGVALISISDDEQVTLQAMNWCMRLAKDMKKAYENGSLIGKEEAWKNAWLPLLGFDITAIYFYSSTFSLKKFAEMFGQFRAEAFAAIPPVAEGRKLRIIGSIPAKSPNNKRWRIALFCSHPTAHGHGLPHFIWWLASMDRERFEPVLILHQTSDNAVHIEELLQHYPVLQDYAPIIIAGSSNLKELADFDFDLLYNFDDLCNGRNEYPAYLRVAHKQITAFYTPATTGCIEMDHFITSPDLDPKTDNEFTEKVVLSQGMPFCFHYASYFANALPIKWSDNTIPEDSIVYTMGASMLTKLRPEFIDALFEILKQIPKAVCVVMPSTRPKDRVHLTEYMVRKCHEAGITPDRLRFYPVAGRSLLHNMIKRSDIFLDFFPFSGTNNILDPLAVGTPCVTLCPPYGFSRNRIAAAILRTLGLNELIATTPNEYVELAVKLGNNAQLRQSIKLRMGNQKLVNSPLCNGPAFVARMEDVIENILLDSRKKATA
ncbi:MAG: hypothetical protein WAO98_05775 [Alphaproteobacteria bacterium]